MGHPLASGGVVVNSAAYVVDEQPSENLPLSHRFQEHIVAIIWVKTIPSYINCDWDFTFP